MIPQLRELEARATPPPWYAPEYNDDHDILGPPVDHDKTVAGNYSYEEGGIVRKEDRELIVVARNALPLLLAALEAERAECEAWRKWKENPALRYQTALAEAMAHNESTRRALEKQE